MPSADPPLPLRHGVDEAYSGALFHALKAVIFGCLYVLISAGLIASNKYLIDKDRFPFATPLVWLHVVFCSVCSVVLYLVWPALFPSLTDPDRKVVVDRWVFLTGAVPIAVFFSVQLVLSNTAYLHLSVAFLQMVKETNIIFVYIFSLVLVMERFSWRNVAILTLLLLATTMTIAGELHFSWIGFVMALTSQVVDSAKIVLQTKLLSESGRKLDALTYVLIMSPCAVVLIGIWMCWLYIMPTEEFRLPAWKDLVTWWPYLLGNASLAFCLNVSLAVFVKYVSAMGLIFTGIVKDVCVVVASSLILSEVISPTQGIGFTLQLSCIGLWSTMKMFPEKFEVGVVSGMSRVFCPSLCTQKDTTNVPCATDGARNYGSNAAATVGPGTDGAAAAPLPKSTSSSKES